MSTKILKKSIRRIKRRTRVSPTASPAAAPITLGRLNATSLEALKEADEIIRAHRARFANSDIGNQ